MNSAILFKASQVPLIPAFNQSVIQKNGQKFTDRDDIVQYIESKNPKSGAPILLEAICQCGRDYSYAVKEDIPESNVVCVCGRNLLIYAS
jgi:hypothetical protein